VLKKLLFYIQGANMKLYFSPGACCMSCHIALEETKIPFELAYVGKGADEATRKAFLQANPAGAVPALELNDKRILTQNIAILEYIADQKPAAGLIAEAGTVERAEIMMWTSLIAADLHKSFAPLFGLAKISSNPEAQADIKKWCFASIDKYLSIIDGHLQDKTYLAAERFTIADCYLFTVYQWAPKVSLPTEKYAALNRYADRIAERPSVVAVHKREVSHS
jgi:glutathione S-transferase